MCNKLLQIYACGHSKSICTTPCGHALKPTQTSNYLATSTATVIQSNSTVSSVVSVSRSPSRNFSLPQPSNNSPLRIINTPSATSSSTQAPASRFIPSSTPSPTSLVSPVSPSFANSTSPSHLPSPSPPAVEVNIEPTFCSYCIPRYLVTSKYPCIECYGKSEWAELRARWLENYRLGHPLDKVEDVEILNGVSGMLGRCA